MPFVVDPNASISTEELANRDATYAIVRFKAEAGEGGVVVGKASSTGGLHAEEHFAAWCRDADNAPTIRDWLGDHGTILEIFLTKSPCGESDEDHNCANTVIELAGFLNGREFGMNHLYLVMMGMHRGRHDPISQAALERLRDAAPLIECFVWDDDTADPFDQTDHVLSANLARGPEGPVMQYDNSANPRRGTDVAVRTRQLTLYMQQGLGYKDPISLDDEKSDGMD